MDADRIKSALADITSEQDATLKSLKLRSGSNLERLKNEITLVKESLICSCYSP